MLYSEIAPKLLAVNFIFSSRTRKPGLDGRSFSLLFLNICLMSSDVAYSFILS